MKKTEHIEIEQLAKAERLEYLRQWRAKNRDRVKLHNANYWKRRAERKLLESRKRQD